MVITVTDQFFDSIERVFNLAGSIPFVATVSGAARVVLGKVQAVAGAALTAVGLFGQLTNTMIGSKTRRYRDLTNQGMEHFVHGVLNASRGMCEAVFGFNGTGSAVLFFTQALSENGFNPFFRYVPRAVNAVNLRIEG